MVSAAKKLGGFLNFAQEVLSDNSQAWYWDGQGREIQETRPQGGSYITKEFTPACVVKFNDEAKQASVGSGPLAKPYLVDSNQCPHHSSLDSTKDMHIYFH